MTTRDGETPRQRPRASIAIPAGPGDTAEALEIPFVIGVLGDFSGGTPAAEMPVPPPTPVDVDGADWQAAIADLGLTDSPAIARSPLWAGVRLLADGLDATASVRIRLIDIGKAALSRDLLEAPRIEDTALFGCLKAANPVSGAPAPFALLVGAYAFSASPDDVETLSALSRIAAAVHAFFVGAADPAIFDAASFHTLPDPGSADRLLEDGMHERWRAFRAADTSTHVALALPNMATQFANAGEGTPEVGGINPAFAVAGRLIAYFRRDGTWGGMTKAAALSEVGLADPAVPLVRPEAGIDVPLANDLAGHGFLVLHHGDAPGGQAASGEAFDGNLIIGTATCHMPKPSDRPEVAQDSAIAARIPFILTTSRFLHALRILARGWLTRFGVAECEARLNRWLMQYVDGNPLSGDEMKVRYPLAEARLVIKEIPGEPGARDLVVWLRPWLHDEALSTSAQLVTRVPD